MHRHLVWSVVLAGFAAFLGCGGDGGGIADGGGGEATVTEEGIKRRAASSLPKVGEFMPPLDDGKVELAPPEGWNILSRDSRYLARFAKGKQSELPRITIIAGDTPDPTITDVTPENCDQLADVLMKQMKIAKRLIEEPCLPLYLGDTLFIRHVRRASLSGDPVSIQGLETVRGGRLYSIELTVTIDAPRAEEYEASLKKYRDYGYAVAANMRFVGDSPPAEAVPAEAAPATAPAEEPAKP